MLRGKMVSRKKLMPARVFVMRMQTEDLKESNSRAAVAQDGKLNKMTKYKRSRFFFNYLRMKRGLELRKCGKKKWRFGK